MLVAQNADRPAAAQQFDGAMESFAAVKQFHSGASSHTADVRIDVAVTELLINRAVSNITDVVGEKLREQFPVAQMTENEHHRSAIAQLAMHRLDVFDLNVPNHFLHRHRAQFYAAKKVCSQTLKVQTHKPTHFAGSFFRVESNCQVA